MAPILMLMATLRGGFEVGLSALSPPEEVEVQIFKGANAARFVQLHKFPAPKGRSVVRISLAGVPISRDAVEVEVEESHGKKSPKEPTGKTYPERA